MLGGSLVLGANSWVHVCVVGAMQKSPRMQVGGAQTAIIVWCALFGTKNPLKDGRLDRNVSRGYSS